MPPLLCSFVVGIMKYETFDDLFETDNIAPTNSENAEKLKKAQAEFHARIGYRKSNEPVSPATSFSAALIALKV